MVFVKRLTHFIFLLLSLSTAQVSAAPACRRKDRCGLGRHTICRDGVEVCARFRQGGTCGPCPKEPSQDTKYLYWASNLQMGSNGMEKIGRVNLDDSSDVLEVSLPGCDGLIAVHSPTGDADLSEPVQVLAGALPKGLAIDSIGNEYYWTTDTTVNRVSIDGGIVESFLSDSRSQLRGITADPVNQKLYLSECTSQTIFTCNADVQCAPLSEWPAGPCGQSISLDTSADKLYVTSGNELYQSKMDGSGRALLVALEDYLAGVVASPSNGIVYWAEGLKLKMAPATGEFIAAEVGILPATPRSLALSHP